MTENRSSPRSKTFYKGMILFNGHLNSVACVVRDMSDVGARLSYSGTVTIPDSFELQIANKQQIYPAYVRWRQHNELGVEFELSAATAAMPHSTNVNERLQKLETEVVALRRLLRQLKNGAHKEVA